MQKEPVLIMAAIRIILNVMIQGLIVFGVITLTSEQHSWLTVSLLIAIEAMLWLFTRNEVWAPGGAPTHPPTEDLWSNKLAAVRTEDASLLAAQKAEYEALFSAPGHAGGDTFAAASKPVAVPLSQETQENLVDSVNPGQEES